MDSTVRSIFFEAGEWLLTFAILYVLLVLFIKLLLRFRPVFAVLEYASMPGTIVHEFGHFIVCKLHRLEVVKVKWFYWRYMLRPSRSRYETSGIRGYVSFLMPPSSTSSKLFVMLQVGAAPLIIGSMVWLICVGIVHVLISDSSQLSQVIPSPYEYLLIISLLWVALAASGRMLPSDADLQIDNGGRLNPETAIDRLSIGISKVLLAFNWLLRRNVEGVYAWGGITLVLTLIVLLKFSIPGGEQYLEPLSIVVSTVREIAAEFRALGEAGI